MQNFGRFTYDSTYRVGDRGNDVRLAREALNVLNIRTGGYAYADYFDLGLRYAVVSFQNMAGLYASGELCPNTLVNLYIRLQNTTVTQDVQFETALGILTGEIEWEFEQIEELEELEEE